jgi:adenosylcobinamide kinase / adenosylcobinamide-phosphate guanylyltransferase
MLILITGGSRSGKSGFALQLGEQQPGPRVFLATATPFDDEMAGRIAAHQRARPAGWRLVEEPVLVPDALEAALESARTVIVDCVTVWMANLLLGDDAFDEEMATTQAEALVSRARAADATRGSGSATSASGSATSASGSATSASGGAKSASGGAVIVVTNEVGSGIVPDNPISRRFRDCAGRANQVIARAADEVYHLVAGIPIKIKPTEGDRLHG